MTTGTLHREPIDEPPDEDPDAYRDITDDELDALEPPPPPRLGPAAEQLVSRALTRSSDRKRDLNDVEAAYQVGELGPGDGGAEFDQSGESAYLRRQALEGAGPGRLTASIINWGEFWGADHKAEDWLIPSLVARGRSHVLYAGAKTGKSLIVLAAVVAAARGQSVFGQHPVEPIRVLYLDYEMTEADLHERLTDMGYGPDGDWRNLEYASLPGLRSLDKRPDGLILADHARSRGIDLVVIDTTTRAVSGEENSADTYQALYANTLQDLKRDHIATLRLDHAGKDGSKGQRGSSAKNDDVDVVWKLRPVEDGFTLEATHARMGWIPKKLVLEAAPAHEPLGYTIKADAIAYPARTKELAAKLDSLEVSMDISVRAAVDALRDAGVPRRTDAVGAALRWRKAELPAYAQASNGGSK